jgi:hypothetical protein
MTSFPSECVNNGHKMKTSENSSGLNSMGPQKINLGDFYAR